MRRTARWMCCLVLPALVAGCGGEAPEAGEEAGTAGETAGEAAGAASEGEAPPTELTGEAFAPGLDVDLEAMDRRESGLHVRTLEEGEGPRAAPGDTMGVHYTVWLPDGSQLDSSHDRGAPLEMVLGETPLIEGWTEGVTGMRLGERRRLAVPWDLAYGAEGRPPQIPPYTPLVFEVELAEHAPAGGG